MYQLKGSLTKNQTKISFIHYWSKFFFFFFFFFGFYLLFCDRYHLKDVIVGKIYFLLVRIKIKHMEIDIIKRETTGTGPSVYHENDTIAKYEIMDGAPVRGERLSFSVTTLTKKKIIKRLNAIHLSGESIPIRLFLAGYDLTPTMRDINKKFSVRYYLNLVLIDEEERRYFKQQVWGKKKNKSEGPRL